MPTSHHLQADVFINSTLFNASLSFQNKILFHLAYSHIMIFTNGQYYFHCKLLRKVFARKRFFIFCEWWGRILWIRNTFFISLWFLCVVRIHWWFFSFNWFTLTRCLFNVSVFVFYWTLEFRLHFDGFVPFGFLKDALCESKSWDEDFDSL